MSNEPPPEPQKKRGFFYRWVPASVAGRTAVATFLVLLLTLIVVWVLRRFGPQSVPSTHAITPLRMLIEFALVLVIPAVLYWGLRRWHQVIEGVYPDIDQAWQKGIDTLQAQGIRVADYPIFLIVGSSSTQLEQGLIHALETKISVNGIPNDAGIHHALQWYTSSDAIYLFCPGASALSALLARWTTSASSQGPRLPLPVPQSPAAQSPQAQQPEVRPVAASQPARVAEPAAPKDVPSGPPAAPQAPAAKQSYLGTIQFESVASNQVQKPLSARPEASPQRPFAMPPATPPTAPIGNQAAAATPQYGGTVSVDQVAHRQTSDAPGRSGALGRESTVVKGSAEVETDRKVPIAPSATEQVVTKSEPPHSVTAPRLAVTNLALPPALDTSDQIARLRYVCRLLSRSRRPRCGVNGIVTLIPFELSRAGPLQLSALAQSARGDVTTIQETLGIRAPVTAMLVGLEQDKGFIELVRRLQPELLSRRLGGRFDLRSRPTPEELNAHSDRLCDAFEDWVYRLFGRDDALAQQRGNRKLYALISRIRHELKPRLRIVMGDAFGCEPKSSPGGEASQGDRSFFFSGCYFAGSGVSTGQPAFVKGVLQDKLLEEQSQVEWTSESRRMNRFLRLFAALGWVVTAVLAILLIAKWIG